MHKKDETKQAMLEMLIKIYGAYVYGHERPLQSELFILIKQAKDERARELGFEASLWVD